MWISTEERMPTPQETILFSWVNIYGERRASIGFYDGGWWEYESRTAHLVYGVTHWMLIPEVP